MHLGGLWCASQINKAYRLAKKHGYELPEKIKPAIKYNSEVFDAKYGEGRHAEIASRVGIAGGNYECGFTYLPKLEKIAKKPEAEEVQDDNA